MSRDEINSIAPVELHRLIQEDSEIELIDVRPRRMYDRQRVEIAEFVDFTNLDPREFMASRRLDASAPVYIICQVGIRSVEACRQFEAADFDNVVNIEGGTQAWVDANLPTIVAPRPFAFPEWLRFWK